MTTATSVPPKNEVRASSLLRKTLLLCGIASSVNYILADIFAATHWEQYSFTSRAVSELMAIGTPTRPFIVSIFTLSGLFSIAFAAGVWHASVGRRSLQITSVLLIYSVAACVAA